MNDPMRPNDKNPQSGGGGPTPPRYSRSLLGWVILIGLGVALAVVLTGALEKKTPMDIRQFWVHVDNNDLVDTIVVKPDKIEGDNRFWVGQGCAGKAS